MTGQSEWLERLGPCDLPVFRRTARLLAEFAQQGADVKSSDITAAILADPLMTLRVLHDANAHRSKHLGSETVTVNHALMMIGLNIFLEKNRSLKTVEEALDSQPAALQAAYEQLQRSFHASRQARDFAALHLDIQTEEVEVAALLGGVTELLFCLAAPEAALKLRRLRRNQPTEAAERAVLGGSLNTLQQAVLAAWKMPEMVIEMLAQSTQPRPRQIMLRAAGIIARRAESGWWYDDLAATYDELARLLGQLPDQIAAIVHSNAVHAARAGAWIPGLPVARWLPMLPGEWPHEADKDEEKEEESKPASAPAKNAAAAEASTCPVPNKRIFEESLKAIETHLDGSLTLSQMSAQILRGLHSGLGLSRILFAMLTPDGKRVRARFTLGIAAEDPLRHFEVNLATKDMFGQLMARMQGIWLNSGNRGRLWPLVHPKLQHAIGEGDFYAMSLFASNKPIGLIYADRGHGNCDLDAGTYTDFKLICLQAARGLAKAKPD